MVEKEKISTKEPRVLTEAERIICKMYLEDYGKYKSCNEYKILQGLLDGEIIVKKEINER